MTSLSHPIFTQARPPGKGSLNRPAPASKIYSFRALPFPLDTRPSSTSSSSSRVSSSSVLYILKDRGYTTGVVISLLPVRYGIFRSFLEFFRLLDAQVNFVPGPFTIGQLLSSAKIVAGLLMLFLRRNGSRYQRIKRDNRRKTPHSLYPVRCRQRPRSIPP